MAASALLQSLPGRVSNEAERLFLSEAIACFRSKAFRAAIVMTWNLAYDHLLNWVMANHLPAFNTAIVRKYPKRNTVSMTKKEDFTDEFTEFEAIEVCGVAGIIDSNFSAVSPWSDALIDPETEITRTAINIIPVARTSRPRNHMPTIEVSFTSFLTDDLPSYN